MPNNKAELDNERSCLSLQESSVQCHRIAPSSDSMTLNHPTKLLVDEIDTGGALDLLSIVAESALRRWCQREHQENTSRQPIVVA